MSKLEKHAWLELVGVGVGTLIFPLFMYSMAKSNVQGIGYVIIVVVVGSITAFLGSAEERRRRADYDERERKIYYKAFRWSTYVFIGYCMLMVFSAFFLIGGGGVIRVVHLPVFLIVGFFVAQLVQSATVLILCNMGVDDE